MRVIAGYRLVRELGSGATGTVYLTDPAAALKVVHPHISCQPALRQQLVEGASLAGSLDHPNIVPVVDHGDADGLFWTAMEFIDGVDADAELRAGRMDPARAVRIIAEIALAVDHIHSLGVLHGDIKPANFFLSLDDSIGERVQLADFGLAHVIDCQPPRADDVVLLSAAYAAPEVLCGRHADGRADIYSLGCSLFRILTGRPPFFDADSKTETIGAQLHRAPPMATQYAPWLPFAVDDVIETAMAKDPESRYPSAHEFVLALAAAM